MSDDDADDDEIAWMGARMARLTCPMHDGCDEQPEVWVVKPRVPGASNRFLLVCPTHLDGWILLTNHIRAIVQFQDATP